MQNLSEQLVQLLSNPNFALPFLLWSFVWKGVALWKAANKRQLPWFLIILLINTMGILEIAYIFFLNKYELDKDGKMLKFLEDKFSRKKK